uniref:Uncharacterized protein n=1 Tax=Solanum lycopersicum TaxID=4081 RepID=A0A3Q7JLS9_SOLLC
MATGFCSINTCLVLNRRSDSIFRHFPSSYPTSWSTQKRSSIRTMKCRCQSTGTDEPKTKVHSFDNASNLLTNLLEWWENWVNAYCRRGSD